MNVRLGLIVPVRGALRLGPGFFLRSLIAETPEPGNNESARKDAKFEAWEAVFQTERRL